VIWPPEIVRAVKEGKYVFMRTDTTPSLEPPDVSDSPPEFWIGDDPAEAPEGYILICSPRR